MRRRCAHAGSGLAAHPQLADQLPAVACTIVPHMVMRGDATASRTARVRGRAECGNAQDVVLSSYYGCHKPRSTCTGRRITSHPASKHASGHVDAWR